jgi:hypothetical protein
VSASIDDDIMNGAWRQLCVGLLLQAVHRLRAETNLFHPGAYVKAQPRGGNCKEGIYQKREARSWIDGGIGTITYEECCEAVGVDPDRAREKILEHCRARRRKPVERYWE